MSEYLEGPSMCLSVCRVSQRQWDWRSHYWNTVLQTMERGHCRNTLLCNNDLGFNTDYVIHSMLEDTDCCATITSDRISTTITYVIWRKERLWKDSVLLRVRLSNLV
jgi:hypothetical protein